MFQKPRWDVKPDPLRRAALEYLALEERVPARVRGRLALSHGVTALIAGVFGIGGGFVLLMAAMIVPHHFGLEGAARQVVGLLLMALGFGCVPLTYWRLKVATARNYERALRGVKRAETIKPAGVSGQSGAVIPNVKR